MSLLLTVILSVSPGAPPPPPSVAPLRLRIGANAGRYHVRSEATEGDLSSFGATAGVGLMPWLDLEVDYARPEGRLSRQYSGISFSFAGEGASREEIERLGVLTRITRERRVTAVFSFVAVFHPALPSRRLEPRFYLGLTRQQASERTTNEPLRLPAGVTLEQVLRIQPLEERHERTIEALTFGAGMMVGLTRHLAIGPDLRYDFGSLGDEIENAYRASFRVEWAF